MELQTQTLRKTYNKRFQTAIIQYLMNPIPTQDSAFLNAISLILEEMTGVCSAIKATYLANTIVMLRLNNYNLIENYKKLQTLTNLVIQDSPENQKIIVNQLVAFGIYAASQSEAEDPMKKAAIEALTNF